MTEAEVTRMLARKRLARSLLETRKWISMFVTPYQDHRHTIRTRLCSCIENTHDNLGLYQDHASQVRLSDEGRRLQRHSYASTSAPFSQNSDSTSASRTSPSPRRNNTVSAACFLVVFLLPNIASQRLSAAVVSFTCRCTAHSISSRRSGVANSGEL